jgi:hypothetical protein
MATNSLIIKDGNGAFSKLSANSSSTGLIPEHSISGAVNITASAANPVYVTGAVQISQPVNVDIVVGDNVFVTSSLAAPLYISSSANSPVLVTGTVNVNNYPAITTVTASSGNPVGVHLLDINPGYTTGAGTAKSALLVYLTGAAGNKIEIKDLTLNDGKVPVTSSYANPVYTTGLLEVTTSLNNPALVQINNDNINEALTALSYSYTPSGGGSLKVKLTGSNIYYIDANNEAVLVKTTGSSVTIDNNGFQQAINYLTAATDLSNNDYKLKVIVTGSVESNPIYVKSIQSNPVYVTGAVSIDNLKTTQIEGEETLVVKISGSTEPLPVTGNFTLDYASYALPSGSALVVKVTASAQDPITVTGTLSIASIINPISVSNVNSISGNVNVTSSKGNPVFVISDNDKPVYVANTSSNGLFITASDSFPLQIQKRSATQVQTQRYVANVFGFDWSVNSGTFVMATPDKERKSLIIANPSDQELYISVGSSSDPGFINGFLLQGIQTAPETYAFIIYPSGTYTADEYAASLFHAGFYISQSVNNQKALVTRIGY